MQDAANTTHDKDENIDAKNLPIINVIQQYIKHLSFENDAIVDISTNQISLTEMPNVNVNITAEASGVSQDTFEVRIKVTSSAITKDTNKELFNISMIYGAVFTVSNIPHEDLEPVLLIYCPSIIFPFARRVISDITRDSGFPPLMLEMVDFAALYKNSKKQ